MEVPPAWDSLELLLENGVDNMVYIWDNVFYDLTGYGIKDTT
jgi:hypothetical protein